jgi:hypothetical protein
MPVKAHPDAVLCARCSWIGAATSGREVWVEKILHHYEGEVPVYRVSRGAGFGGDG